ncbi:uncharacterized protein J3D65DRAFT_313060 [Phyllosticta citribraziliensis]|uniref:Uncharacterized protein n=1 Tax=Phyllosticta citribraziliensis TaxID=989973 RepID=A0ABR1LVG0_9PEZI
MRGRGQVFFLYRHWAGKACLALTWWGMRWMRWCRSVRLRAKVEDLCHSACMPRRTSTSCSTCWSRPLNAARRRSLAAATASTHLASCPRTTASRESMRQRPSCCGGGCCAVAPPPTSSGDGMAFPPWLSAACAAANDVDGSEAEVVVRNRSPAGGCTMTNSSGSFSLKPPIARPPLSS